MGGGCAVFFYFNLILIRFFFSPSPQPTLNAEATLRSLAARHIQGLSSSSLSLMRRPPRQRAVSSLSLLPILRRRRSFSRRHRRRRRRFFPLALLVDCYLCPPPSLSSPLSHRRPLPLPSPIIRDSNSIGVNNFAIHTVTLYFTASTDKPTTNARPNLYRWWTSWWWWWRRQ